MRSFWSNVFDIKPQVIFDINILFTINILYILNIYLIYQYIILILNNINILLIILLFDMKPQVMVLYISISNILRNVFQRCVFQRINT